MEMRKLNTNDIFKMVKMIGKLGLDNIKKYITAVNISNSKNTNIREMGADIFIDIICLAAEKLPHIENDLCGFIGGICGKTPKEIGELPPAETENIIYDIAHKEEFGDFFTAVSRFFVSETKKKKGK